MTVKGKGGRMPLRFLNPFPKYLQIREILVRRIEREMKVGDRLPTEHGLSAQFGVSREAVRSALALLEADGLIFRAPGQGTFVAALPSGGRERRFTGLSEDFTRFKLDTEAKVLFNALVQPSAKVRDLMALRPDAKAYRVYRLRMLEGAPFAVHEAVLSAELGARVAKHDLTRTSVVDVLHNRLKLPVWEDQQLIDAVAADTELAGLLDVSLGAPLLHIVRLFKDPAGKPAVLFRTHYRSDRYYYTVKLAHRASLSEDEPVAQARPRARTATAEPRLTAASKRGRASDRKSQTATTSTR